jgi:endonuclease III related protein
MSNTERRKSDKRVGSKLKTMYRALFRAYGPQRWWPGDTPFEVMIGAVLTQNTAWGNVEKAIANLKRERMLTLTRLSRVPVKRLAGLIRPSGYFNIKARRLKHLLDFLRDRSSGSLVRLFSLDLEDLRRMLLGVNGIGPETADSILLYAGGKPFFVVDAYTKRIFSRHGLVDPDADYHEVQGLFMDNLPKDASFYNEYHALIVRVGKERCKKTRPLCKGCPLEKLSVLKSCPTDFHM